MSVVANENNVTLFREVNGKMRLLAIKYSIKFEEKIIGTLQRNAAQITDKCRLWVKTLELLWSNSLRRVCRLNGTIFGSLETWFPRKITQQSFSPH
jgi:hypothetical protein